MTFGWITGLWRVIGYVSSSDHASVDGGCRGSGRVNEQSFVAHADDCGVRLTG